MSTKFMQKKVISVSANNSTAYSDAIDFARCTGEMAVLISCDNDTSDITITLQFSYDGDNFYAAQDGSGNALGAVISGETGLSGTPLYVQPSPALAPYMRFVVTENDAAAAVVSLSYAIQEE